MAGLARRSHARDRGERLRHVLDVAAASLMIAILAAGLAILVTVLAYWMEGLDLVRDFLWMGRR
mgnify:CR=1 FL=1